MPPVMAGTHDLALPARLPMAATRLRGWTGVLQGLAGSLAVAASFYVPGGWLLAWVALLPLVLLAGSESRSFRLGLGVAVIAFGPALAPWLVLAARLWALNLVALGTGIALTWLVTGVTLAGWLVGARLLLRLPSPRPAIALAVACLWVAIEYGRMLALVALAGPFFLLGYTQVEVLPMVQVADVTGAFGISFAVVLSNVALALALHPGRGRRALLSLAALAPASLLGYGVLRQRALPRGEPLRLAAVRVEFPNGVRWHEARYRPLFEEYLELSEQAVKRGASLILWPENAVPLYLRYEERIREHTASFCRRTGSWLLLGTTDMVGDPARNPTIENSAFVFAPDGRIAGRYSKREPVPFAERLPFYNLLSRFYTKGEASDMAPGQSSAPLAMAGARAGVLICWESAMPHLSRENVLNGADLLLNLANETTLGTPLAWGQMMRHSRLRAVEHRRWLVRAVNAGFAAVVSPEGRLVATSRDGPGILVQDVERISHRTFYARHGDLFAQLCSLSALVALLAGVRRRRSRRS